MHLNRFLNPTTPMIKVYKAVGLNKILQVVFLFIFLGTEGQDIYINEFMSGNTDIVMDDDGDYSDWIELYNNSNSAVDLSGFSLSDDVDDLQKWTFPLITIEPKGFLLVFASGKDKYSSKQIHTNFKIKGSGEQLILSNKDSIINHIEPIEIPTNKSYGRISDGVSEFVFFQTPTPNISNNNSTKLNTMVFSPPSTLYTKPFDLSITSSDSTYYSFNYPRKQFLYEEKIHIGKESRENIYSLIPTNSIPYHTDYWLNEQFGWQAPNHNISKATVVCASTYNTTQTSDYYINTYLVKDKAYSFPVISLITDSLNLYCSEQGIYVPGNNYDSLEPEWSGNYYMTGENWEKIGYLQYFNREGILQFSQNMGFRIHGGKSRIAPQKSLRFYARKEYGNSYVDFPLFKERSYTEYKRFILRSSYTFWWGENSLFQDDLIHTILFRKHIDLELQLSEPIVLFINSEYWGIHNIRERQDKYYLASLYDINSNEIDIIEGNLNVIEGSADSFIEIIDYVRFADMSIKENYNFVADVIDIPNLIDYTITQLFFGNFDWPQNNIKMWRSSTNQIKWRWLFYDLDAAMKDFETNNIERFFTIDCPIVVLVKNLLNNHEFNELFTEQFKYHLSETFLPYDMISMLSEFKSFYEPEIQEHIDRWNSPKDIRAWNESTEHIADF